MSEMRFPVSDYLRPHVIDGRTVARAGGWWTAILLIEDPQTRSPYIALYKWHNRSGSWRKASSFKINSSVHLHDILEVLPEFGKNMK